LEEGEVTVTEIAFFVAVEIDPAQRQSFHRIMTEHARGTQAEEKGCLAFGVYVDPGDPNRYALYERYADEAALDAHRTSVRLARFRKATDAMIAGRRIWALGEEYDVSHFPGRES
jgi:quinol monooxygenase YgiN